MIALFVYIVLPLVFSGTLHMVVVKFDVLPAIKVPVSTSLFGKNKTLRGFVFMTLFNSLMSFLIGFSGSYFAPAESLIYGAIFGLAYALAELPNSYLKRRLGIISGEKSSKRPLLMMLFDKSDSAAGVSMVATLLLGLSIMEMLGLFVMSVLVHIFFSVLLVLVGIKKRF